MRSLYTIALWVTLPAMLLFFSCDKMDVNEEFELKATIEVQGSNAQFVGEDLLDALSQSDQIDKYASHIKSIEITEVKYLVTYLGGSSSQQITTGTLEVAHADGSEAMVISTVNNMNLMQAMTEGAFVFDQVAIDTLAGLIKDDPHQAMIYLRGEVNETPVDFTVVVKFTVKMVAEVI